MKRPALTWKRDGNGYWNGLPDNVEDLDHQFTLMQNNGQWEVYAGYELIGHKPSLSEAKTLAETTL